MKKECYSKRNLCPHLLSLFFLTLIFCLIGPASAQAQQGVSGTVTSAIDGTPLPGVSIIVQGTTNGVVTDFDGNYQLNNVSADATLEFSYIGFISQSIAVGGQTEINVAMEEDLEQLSEVVVVGYGEQKREAITGSVVSIKTSELVKTPTVNVSNSIAGRMPGVIATQSSGEPGNDGSTIRIRGTNSFGDSSPLVVIDGVPAREGGFARLNPADIESISVLKDASAAIYGARAANGVILVTTKRGSEGKTSVTYTSNIGFSQPTVIPELAGAVEYSEMRNDLEIYKLPVSQWADATRAFRETGTYTRPDGSTVTAPFSPEDRRLFANGSDPWGHPNTDWFDATMKGWSLQERHNLQLDGGSENFRFLTSLGYQDQDAYYKNSATNYQQYDLRINLDAKVSDHISTQIGVLARQEDRNFPTKGAGAIFRMLMRGIPTEPAYWPNGMPGPDIEYGENPVVITTSQTGYDRDRRYYFQTNGKVDIKIPGIEGLKFTGTAAIDKYIQQKKRWEIPWYLYTWQGDYEADGVTPALVRGKRGPAEPNLRQENQDQLNILLGATLTYDRTFGEHSINVLAGTNKETIRNDNFFAYRRYFISEVIDQMFAGGDAEKDNGGAAWERARLNYFGRVAYNFSEKYLFEFLWRYDGSYMFPEDSRYGFFPGVMVGWRISEEDFWRENIPFVNSLKLRGSWGQMGNDNIYYDDALQEYQYYSTYGFGSYVTDGKVAKTLYETRVPNPLITWEQADNYNIGLDGQMMDGKLFFEFDAFLNKRSSILWRRNASIPQSTGMSLPAENIGKVENKGWEFNVGYNGKLGEEVYFQFAVNGGYAKNKIKFWDEAPGAPEWQRSTGRAIDAGLYYIYDGVFRDQEDIAANTLDYSDITNNIRPGDMKYKDFDGDGAITPDDRVRRDMNTQPTFQGGANLQVRYKDFDLTVLLQGSAGAEVPILTYESGAIGNYLMDFYENRWTVDNPSSVHPRITDRSDQYYSDGNTYWLRDTDYLRLKNIEIGYTLPSEVGEEIGISNLRFYMNGLNVATWSKMKVMDPESVQSVGHYYPQARIINFGMSVTF